MDDSSRLNNSIQLDPVEIDSPLKIPVPNSNQYLKFGIFESAVALHSIIIGFDLGSLGTDDVSTIKSLMIAVAFHQFFEGFTLGTMIVSFPTIKLSINALLISIYSLTTPIGILIGIFTSSTSEGDHAKGIANGLAAGFLFYSGLVGMILEAFSRPIPYAVAKFNIPIMCTSMMMGAAFMGLLAAWA